MGSQFWSSQNYALFLSLFLTSGHHWFSSLLIKWKKKYFHAVFTAKLSEVPQCQLCGTDQFSRSTSQSPPKQIQNNFPNHFQNFLSCKLCAFLKKNKIKESRVYEEIKTLLSTWYLSQIDSLSINLLIDTSREPTSFADHLWFQIRNDDSLGIPGKKEHFRSNLGLLWVHFWSFSSLF